MILNAIGPNGPLQGVFTGNPTKSQPVVLIIPGSGPTDCDGNSPLGVKAAPYRLLAEALAKYGISSIRIDKRGMYGSAAAVPDANDVSLGDYAKDVELWGGVVRERIGGGCIWLLGHSEGGLVALAAAARVPDRICGLILVATAGRPMGEVLKSQLAANPANAPLLDPAFRAVDLLAVGEPVDVNTLPPQLVPLFNPIVQDFLISLFRPDPAELIRQISLPVLILQGERDLQTGVEDARRLKDAQPNAKLVLLPNINHVLKRVTSPNRDLNIAAYADPDLPLAPGVAEAIADFIL